MPEWDVGRFVHDLCFRKDCYQPMVVLEFEFVSSVGTARMDCSQALVKQAAKLQQSLQQNTVLVVWTASAVQLQLETGEVRHLCDSGRVAEDCLRR